MDLSKMMEDVKRTRMADMRASGFSSGAYLTLAVVEARKAALTRVEFLELAGTMFDSVEQAVQEAVGADPELAEPTPQAVEG